MPHYYADYRELKVKMCLELGSDNIWSTICCHDDYYLTNSKFQLLYLKKKTKRIVLV